MLIEFALTEGGFVLVNPEQITAVAPLGNGLRGAVLPVAHHS